MRTGQARVLVGAMVVLAVAVAAGCEAVLGLSDPIETTSDASTADGSQGTSDAATDLGTNDTSVADSSSEATTDAAATEASADATDARDATADADSTAADSSLDAPIDACGVCTNTYCSPHTCDSVLGCTARPSPCTPASCQAAACDDTLKHCTYTLTDHDGDGHGPGVGTAETAPCDDCDDNDSNVFTGQATYFRLARKSGGFDYNCDGVEEKQYPNIGDCVVNTAGTGCNQIEGWVTFVPSCGGTGTRVQSCSFAGGACTVNGLGDVQYCR